MKINNIELLKIHIDRVRQAKLVDKIMVATTISKDDDIIATLCEKWDVNFSRGQIDDVLDRFYQAVKEIKPIWVVRVTSDCPLIDPAIIDAVISTAQVNDVDYAANVLEERFPDGQDVEVFKFSALEQAWKDAKLKSDREHVTTYLRSNSTYKGGRLFTSVNFPCFNDFSKIRVTVDEQRDFELITKLIQDLGTDLTWLDYAKYIINNNLNHINDHIIRNEGLLKSLKND